MSSSVVSTTETRWRDIAVIPGLPLFRWSGSASGRAGSDALRTADTELSSVLVPNSEVFVVVRLTRCKTTAGDDLAALFLSFLEDVDSADETGVTFAGEAMEDTRVTRETEDAFPEDTDGS